MKTPRSQNPALALVLITGLLSSLPALAANSAEMASLYRQERSDCMNVQAPADRKACLQDATAAYAENKRGGLADVMPTYAQNALRRCDALSADERTACLARMEGQGTTSGSVASGGIYRELVTLESPPPATTTPKQ
jgi:hypothetical protein